MRSLLSCFVSALLFFFAGCPLFSEQAVDFKLKDLSGQLVGLSDFLETHTVLLNFWATWCLPCTKEMPHLQKIHSHYKEKGLVVLAVSIDGPESTALVKNYIQRYGYSFPVLFDSDSSVVSLYNPRVLLPYTVLIDRGGKIRYVHQGYSPGDENVLALQIETIMDEQEILEEKRLSFSVNESFLLRSFSDQVYVDQEREGRKSQILNQLDLSFSGKGYVLGLRFDGSLDFSPLREDFSIAKRFIEFQGRSYNIRLGDFYQTLGRGLLFSLHKTFEREGLEHVIDTTLDGARFEFWAGPFSLDLTGGWIRRPGEDTRDKIIGGSLGWKLFEQVEIRLNGLYSSLEPGSQFNNKNVSMESFSLDIPEIFDCIKFYGEFSLAQKTRYSGPEGIDGHGLYLEAGFFLQNVSLLVEFKDYRQIDFEYNRPPLLESEDLDILANLFDDSTENITGISGRVDFFWPQTAVLFYGKYAYYADIPDEQSLLGRPERKISHVFWGIEKKFLETGFLNALAGFRDEKGAVPYLSTTHGRTFHSQFNLVCPLTSEWSAEADFKIKSFKGQFFSYVEIRSLLSFHWTKHGILTFFYDYTTDPETLAVKDKKNWWAAQLEIKISSSNAVRFFFGSSRGTVKCSAGVCRFFPPFEGLRVEALFRF